jgi:hypothetical protein
MKYGAKAWSWNLTHNHRSWLPRKSLSFTFGLERYSNILQSSQKHELFCYHSTLQWREIRLTTLFLSKCALMPGAANSSYCMSLSTVICKILVIFQLINKLFPNARSIRQAKVYFCIYKIRNNMILLFSWTQSSPSLRILGIFILILLFHQHLDPLVPPLASSTTASRLKCCVIII